MLKHYIKRLYNPSIQSRFFSEAVKSKKKDYYAILGIPKNATEDEVKKAYRNLAKKYHPDVNTTGTELYEPNTQKFRDVAEAYAVLSNKALRLDYDMRNKNFPESVYNSEKYTKILTR